MIQRLSLKKETLKLNKLKPKEKKEFVSSIATLVTPISYMKYCYLSKPFFYPGSHIGRYSLTLLFDKDNAEQAKFLEKLEKLATDNGVDSLGYIDNGLISIKFQTKDQPKIFCVYKGKKKETEICLDHDLPEGFKCSVDFELNTYLNKKINRNSFNFSPRKIIFHLEEDESKIESNEEIEENGNSKSRGNRSRVKDNGIRNSELQPREKRSMGVKLRGRPNPRQNKGA